MPKEYVKERTEGFDALKEAVEKYTPEYVEKISGVPAEDLKKAARNVCEGKQSQHYLRYGHYPAYQRHG
jgi:anaerobic selenocysteine-containing dehydrogenase